jgi:hypothetical protein
MKIVDRSLPYPVLSSTRDDISPNQFDLECVCRSDSQRYYLSYDLRHDNASLNERIDTGTAAYAIHIEARNCFYRVLKSPCPSKGEIEILADDIVGTVEVTGLIVATANIPTYRVVGAHEDYADATFSVRQGDLLAYTRTYTFEAEKEFDPLRRLSSLMQILPGTKMDGLFELDLEQSKITVFLPRNDYQLYAQAKLDPKVSSPLIQGIVLPVLVVAIRDAAEQKNSDQPLKRWAEIIRQRLAEMKIDLEMGGLSGVKPLEYAQAILHHPTHRFLADLLKVTEGGTHESQIHH